MASSSLPAVTDSHCNHQSSIIKSPSIFYHVTPDTRIPASKLFECTGAGLEALAHLLAVIFHGLEHLVSLGSKIEDPLRDKGLIVALHSIEQVVHMFVKARNSVGVDLQTLNLTGDVVDSSQDIGLELTDCLGILVCRL